MDDTLGDTLTIEMSEQVDQMEVLEQERAVLANPLKLLWVRDRSTVGGRVHGLLSILEGRSWSIIGNHNCVFGEETGMGRAGFKYNMELRLRQ
jgi:hypothetical protein